VSKFITFRNKEREEKESIEEEIAVKER